MKKYINLGKTRKPQAKPGAVVVSNNIAPFSETPHIFHIKDPKVKKLLTSHLANLLDELDEQNINNDNKNNIKVSINETNGNKKDKDKLYPNRTNDTNENTNINKDKNKAKEEFVGINEYLKRNDKVNRSHKDYKAELLHLAMHNVILQGLIENTKLDDMYKKVVDLVKDFENDHSTINKGELNNGPRGVFYAVQHYLDYSHSYAISSESDNDTQHNRAPYRRTIQLQRFIFKKFKMIFVLYFYFFTPTVLQDKLQT